MHYICLILWILKLRVQHELQSSLQARYLLWHILVSWISHHLWEIYSMKKLINTITIFWKSLLCVSKFIVCYRCHITWNVLNWWRGKKAHLISSHLLNQHTMCCIVNIIFFNFVAKLNFRCADAIKSFDGNIKYLEEIIYTVLYST
jgi:hypothetical protein